MRGHTWSTFDLIHDEKNNREKVRVNEFLVALLAQGLEDPKAFATVTYGELDSNFFGCVGRHANPIELKNISRIVRIIRGE